MIRGKRDVTPRSAGQGKRCCEAVLNHALLTALTASTKMRIVGKWEPRGASGEEPFGLGAIEFYRDGTLTVNVLGMNTAGTYGFIDNDTIRIEMSGLLSLSGAQVCDVQIVERDDPRDV